MAVRQHYDIAIGLHDSHIPACAPELAHCTLWSSLTVEESRELMVRVVLESLIETYRISHPYEHVIAVGSLHPAWLYATHLNLVEHSLVFKRQLGSLACFVEGKNLVGRSHAVASGDDLIAGESHTAIVGLNIGRNLSNLCLIDIDTENLACAVACACEGEVAAVGIPHEAVTVVVVAGSEVAHLACRHVDDHQSVLVALIAVASHRLEGKVFAIRRESRIGVVAMIARVEIDGSAICHII